SRDLLNRSLDLVIGSDPMEDLVGLERHRLFVEPLVLVMPKGQAKSWNHLSLADLAASVPMVRYSIRSGLGSQIDRHLRRMKIEVPPALEFDATEAVFAMVGAGIGWAITTPLCLLQGRSIIPELSILPLPGPAVARSLYLVLRGGELTVLAERIADISCKTLKNLTKKELMPLAPWLSKHIRVGEGKAE
ncbi:MAG: LysR family transcriptional regulator substrate-binding protein, partial [Rhodospirillales bacterium]